MVKTRRKPLVVVSTHPIQYHAPVFRAIQQHHGIPTIAIYGSDFSVVGYLDREFGTTLAWDIDLLTGYEARFLSRVFEGGARNADECNGKGISQALSEADPGVILLLGYHGQFHRGAYEAARSSGVPLLFRAETSDTAKNRTPLKALIRDLYLRRFYRCFSVLLPIGTQSARHYRRLAPGTPQVFSPYCVDTSPFHTDETDRLRLREEARAALGYSQTDTVVLFVGKLIPTKGPLDLVQAVKHLPPSRRCTIKLLFVGDGILRSNVETVSRDEANVTTTITGFQPQSALSTYYHAADMMVLPSSGETWGLVVNEALHHGVPVVVSDRVGCADDLVVPGETGERFHAGDAQSLAEALDRAQVLTRNQAIRERCRNHIDGYSLDKAAAGIATAYHRVVTE